MHQAFYFFQINIFTVTFLDDFTNGNNLADRQGLIANKEIPAFHFQEIFKNASFIAVFIIQRKAAGFSHSHRRKTPQHGIDAEPPGSMPAFGK